MCNLFDLPGTPFQDNLDHKLDVLRRHSDEFGRDYDQIEKTSSTFVGLGEERQAGLETLLAHLHELAAVGIDHVLLSPRRPWDQVTLDAVASIIPEAHAIPTGSARSRQSVPG